MVEDQDREPVITINGTALTRAQAITVRVACTDLESRLSATGLGEDNLGRNITDSYLLCLSEILVLMGVTS